MKKCVNQIRTSKCIIGFNGASSYVYDLEGNLLETLKDIKSVYNGYVSQDEKVLCLKSTDTYLAFYNTDTLNLINKISFKKCHQPQDQEGCFDGQGNFINLQYTDRLTSDIVVYGGKEYNEVQRYSYEDGVVLETIDAVDEIFIVGFVRPQKEDFALDEIKKYVFRCDDGILQGFEISKEDHLVFSRVRKTIGSFVKESDIDFMKKQYGFGDEESQTAKTTDLKTLWQKYKNNNAITIKPFLL